MHVTVTHIRDLDALYATLGVMAAGKRPCRAYVAAWAQDDLLTAIDLLDVGANVETARKLIERARTVASWWQ